MEVKNSGAIIELLKTLPEKETVQEICIKSIEVIKKLEIYDVSTISIFNQDGILKLKSGFGFDNKVKEEAKRYDIIVVEGDVLTNLYREIGGRKTIDDSIKSIDPDLYRTDKIIKKLK